MLTPWIAAGLAILDLVQPVPARSFKPRRLDARQFNNGTNSTNSGPVSLQISTGGEGRNETAPLLYGWMIEDISHSIDGGLYGELLTNRAFQGSSPSDPPENPTFPGGPVLNGWKSIGPANLSLNRLRPLSEALPTVLKVDFPANYTGEIGFLNEGWWGIPVIPQTYNASFYLQPYTNGKPTAANLTSITVSLRSKTTGTTWASSKISVDNLSGFDYHQVATQLQNTANAPDSNNTFAITFNGNEVQGTTIYFGLFSLFGETFKDRPNGIRKDLGQNIYDLKPKFLRFPGGNNIEGESIQSRWIWNETIGPLINRKGRLGDWGYWNTNGFGLLEFLEWTEDMDLEPVLAIYAGYSLDRTSYPEDEMDPVLQTALDELEYVTGGVDTKWGALRAEHGHPEPFTINYVEIGNEDWFSSTYPYRFRILYDGLKKAYPDIKLISSAYDEAKASFNYTIDLPEGSMWDTHHYEEPHYFLQNFNFFDNWQERTNNPGIEIILGEYSVNQIDDADGNVDWDNLNTDKHVRYPEMLGTAAEATYLLGCERNPNVVKMTTYAPSLANYNKFQWTPNLITFTANPNQTILSASYYAQQLLATYRGTHTLPVTNAKGDFNPLFWVSTIDDVAKKVYLKLTNTATNGISLNVDLDAPFSGVNGTILTSEKPRGYNFFNNQTAISPQPIENLGSNNTGSTFSWTVPGLSVTVLQFDL